MEKNLYDDPILQLANALEQTRPIGNPDRQATATNPLCGDRVTIQLEMDGDEIRHLYCQVRGCVVCRASCTDLARVAAGLDRARLKTLRDTLEQFLKASIDEPIVPAHLEVFAPVRAHRSRHRCVLLPYEATLRALTDPDG